MPKYKWEIRAREASPSISDVKLFCINVSPTRCMYEYKLELRIAATQFIIAHLTADLAARFVDVADDAVEFFRGKGELA